jgi:DNA-binding XRE family transcriptional regulator
MSAKFKDYVKEVEATLSDEERATLDAFRDHYGIANQLLQLRQERKISQVELSRRTGIAQGEISKIERGVMHPRSTTIEKLARGLNARVELVAA